MASQSNSSSGGVATAAGLALFFIALSVISAYLVIDRTWWFPESISTIAPIIDKQFNLTMAVSGIIFVLAQVALGVVIFRFRDRGGQAQYSHGNNRLELLWTVATAVIFVGLAIMGRTAWANMHFMGADPGAMQIEVTGQQFSWTFRYPGADGKFGPTDPAKISEASGNTLGLNKDEADTKDDIVTTVMAVPVNKPVEVILRSKDVIHSFFVPALRIKQDAVPGLAIHIHFTAEKPGDYELACLELCGLGHYRMKTMFRVLSEADFQNWLKEESAK